MAVQGDSALSVAIRAAHRQWSSEGKDRLPPKFEWEPRAGEVATGQTLADQGVASTVTSVTSVTTEKHKTEHCARAEALAVWEERAAILEFDGGFSRREAEQSATIELGFDGMTEAVDPDAARF